MTGQQISRPASYAMYLVCSKELGSPEIWPEPGSASCKALMDFLQQQGAESPSCDWPADLQSIKSCYVCSRKLDSGRAKKYGCKAPMELLQQQTAESPFSGLLADIQTNNPSYICRSMLKCTEIWPEQADICLQATKWRSCNLLLQKFHWSLAAGSGHISGLPRSLLHTKHSLLVWISAGQSQNGDPATCCCRSSMGALQLALAIFQGCSALCCMYLIACWSGYLLASHKMEILQLVVAEAPSEPYSWLWPNFRAPRLSALCIF